MTPDALQQLYSEVFSSRVCELELEAHATRMSARP